MDSGPAPATTTGAAAEPTVSLTPAEIENLREAGRAWGDGQALRHTAGPAIEPDLEVLEERSGYSPGELVGDGRSRHLTPWRQVGYAVLRAFGYSFPEVAYAFGRDHTTVMRGIELALAVNRGDASALLPKSFERPRPEIGEAGDILFGRRSGCPMEMDGGHASFAISFVLTNDPKFS